MSLLLPVILNNASAFLKGSVCWPWTWLTDSLMKSSLMLLSFILVTY